MATFSRFFTIISLLLASSGSVFAAATEHAAEGASAHDNLPAGAEVIHTFGPFAITNSMLMVWLVAIILIVVAQLATRNMTLIPTGMQNFVEMIVETLVDFLGGILGDRLARRTFWFFGTVFIMILASNWMGLIPGVGTVGWNLHGEGVNPHDTFRPFLRGGNADLNMTGAMSITFAIMWFYWAITEGGTKNFFAHIFAPKGKFSGVMMVVMAIIFFLVGLIEVLSIALRPVALMFRLYGNIYAGETMIESVMHLTSSPYLKWLAALPFYFMELLVGFIQALVFALLCAVFLKLICDHDDHDEEHAH